MTGKYRLLQPMCAVHRNHGEKGFIFLPKDATLQIEAVDEAGRLAQARWSGHPVTLFSQDLKERGLKISD